MTPEEFKEHLKIIQKIKCETQNLELKSANKGCPKRLYDTLSSFSNQDNGGIIIFGIDESNDYLEQGVYDAQDLQKKVNEQSLQMDPPVRPLLTVLEKDGKSFVAAEIPGLDIAERPCYYRGQGRLKGSFIRIGDSDEPMTDYEIYSYEAYRKKYQDDIREISRATLPALDQKKLDNYIAKLKTGKPNLATLEDDKIYELLSITRNHAVTLNACLLFSPYPQAYFPQLCITAISVPGTDIGDLSDNGERFLDNQRIEGDIAEILDTAIMFVRKNMHNKTIINPNTGKREDRTDYPLTAVRETIVNALVHRDYSIHTEGMPIQLVMYEDRMEIRNPGGIYGRIKLDQLGHCQPDTRNPVLAAALEVLCLTENRYSGIPTIRKAMQSYGLPAPVFADERGTFVVTFYKESAIAKNEAVLQTDDVKNILLFCKTPRTRKELSKYLGMKSTTYAIKSRINPLIEQGLIGLSIPNKPSSPMQRYYTIDC